MTGLTVRAGARHQVDVRVVGAIDLGKTSCRLRVVVAPDVSVPVFEITDVGAPGLSSYQGVRLAAEAVQTVLNQFQNSSPLTLDSLVIGAAGTESFPDGARELASTVGRQLNAEVLVASDVVIAHAGALAGSAGTVLIAGTGAVALGLDGSGEFDQADGWGPWLGDEGSGRWIGQQGLQAALRSSDGRGPRTALATAMRELIGRPHDVPGWVARGDSPARTLGTFALAVIDEARRGDAVAITIVTEAVAHLVETALAATPAGGAVVLTGGLMGNLHFSTLVREGIAGAGLMIDDSHGSALDGAYLLAVNRLLPHEKKVFRAE